MLNQIRQYLPEALIPHCVHAELDRGELQLFLDSPVWAQRTQYVEPELMAQLRTAGTPDVRKLRVRVLPAHQAPSAGNRRTLALSKESAELIAATAHSITDPSLRGALLKLARRCVRRE